MTRTLLAAASTIALLALGACSNDQSAGNQTARAGIWAAGSSTVFPFATRVAENFARTSGGASPRVEALGTGGGIQAFCQGVGPNTPDIANASRQMKASEFELCRSNGVTDIVEIKIGFDGLVIATARNAPDYGFSGDDLYLALAKEVPGPNGTFIANPHTTWNQVNPGLPSSRILVYGPPPTSGTRDSWLELAMAPSARAIPALAALAESDEDRFETLAHTLREDGAWVDPGENDNAIVQTLTRTPGSTERLRLFLPRAEQRHGEGPQRQRRHADPGDHSLGRVPDLPLDVHLRQEAARRRDAGAGAVRPGVHVRGRRRPRRLSAGPRSGAAPRRPAGRPTRHRDGHDGDDRTGGVGGKGPGSRGQVPGIAASSQRLPWNLKPDPWNLPQAAVFRLNLAILRSRRQKRPRSGSG